MRRQALFISSILALALLLSQTSAHAAEGIRWAKSLRDAMAQAKKTHRIVMVDFYTDWCGWCKRLDKDTYPDARVAKASASLISVKVNAEATGEGVEAAQRYGVQSFPTILFLQPDGSVFGVIKGYLPPDRFAKAVQNVAKSHSDTQTWETQIRNNPKDGVTAARLIPHYAKRGKRDEARKLLTIAETYAPSCPEMTEAYGTLGGSYQKQGDTAQAMGLYRKILQSSKKPLDLAKARQAIAFCYVQQDKMKEATAELEAILQIPNCPPDLRKGALETIKYLKATAPKPR